MDLFGKPVVFGPVQGSDANWTMSSVDAEKAATCEHCWHDTGIVLTVIPPIKVLRCCQCGVKMQRTTNPPRCKHGHERPV